MCALLQECENLVIFSDNWQNIDSMLHIKDIEE